MKTVDIGELKNQLSNYLQFVKDGEEVVVRDRSTPVARILPFRHTDTWDKEEHLVASGVLKMPEQEMAQSCVFISADKQLLEAAGHAGFEIVAA